MPWLPQPKPSIFSWTVLQSRSYFLLNHVAEPVLFLAEQCCGAGPIFCWTVLRSWSYFLLNSVAEPVLFLAEQCCEAGPIFAEQCCGAGPIFCWTVLRSRSYFSRLQAFEIVWASAQTLGWTFLYYPFLRNLGLGKMVPAPNIKARLRLHKTVLRSRTF